MYADVEESFGLFNRAIDVYDRALRQVNKEDVVEVLKIAIAKTSKFFGLSKTRRIYQVRMNRSERIFYRKRLRYCSRMICST